MPHRKDPEAVPMHIITINVPQKHLDFFDKVVKYGLYPSRSEAMRDCINRGMPKIIAEIKETERIIAWDSPESMKDFIEKKGWKLVNMHSSKHERKPKRVPLGNVMWENIKLKSGEVVRVPKEYKIVKELQINE